MTRTMKRPSCRLVRYQSYRAMPWRNGRGSTLEIARDPAVGEEFAWRLSLADIDRDGEFSAYPGYSRALALVAGHRLHLRFRGHGHCSLDPARRCTRFEGDWQTHCAVPDGRCTDLSLIVRAGPVGRSASNVRAPMVLNLESTRRVAVPRNLHGAIFALDGSVAITQSPRTRARILRARDTLLLYPGAERTLSLRRLGRNTAQLIFLRWRAGDRDNRPARRSP